MWLVVHAVRLGRVLSRKRPPSLRWEPNRPSLWTVNRFFERGRAPFRIKYRREVRSTSSPMAARTRSAFVRYELVPWWILSPALCRPIDTNSKRDFRSVNHVYTPEIVRKWSEIYCLFALSTSLGSSTRNGAATSIPVNRVHRTKKSRLVRPFV